MVEEQSGIEMLQLPHFDFGELDNPLILNLLEDKEPSQREKRWKGYYGKQKLGGD
jgi:hypothetical protein